MATLLSALNASYSENASILTGNPNRVTVEVEADIDARFWKDLLQELWPNKDFHFDPYHIDTPKNKAGKNGKGKKKILKSADAFNAYHIGCVDSDYDWLLEDQTDDGKKISNNKYLLQTYSYSIENLLCLNVTLHDYCKEVSAEETEFDFVSYLTQLSRMVYPLLVWSVYLYGQGNQDFTPTDWHSVIIHKEKDAEKSLQIIQKQVQEQMKVITEAHATEYEACNRMQETLEQKGVTPDNAYLYLRGHELFDHLLNSLLDPIVYKLRNQHYAMLRELPDSTLQLQEYQKTGKINLETALCRNYRYKNKTVIYDKIAQDVQLLQ